MGMGKFSISKIENKKLSKSMFSTYEVIKGKLPPPPLWGWGESHALYLHSKCCESHPL